MNDRIDPTLRTLELLRFDGEADPHTVHRTKEMLMETHARSLVPSRSARRIWFGGAFLVALGVGAAAGPRMLEWWEHITVTVDEEMPDGTHHVVLEDDDGDTVFDETLQADEALFQIQPEDGEGAGMILTVAPIAPGDGTDAPATSNPGSSPR